MYRATNRLSLAIGGTGLLLAPGVVTLGVNLDWPPVVVGSCQVAGTVLLVIGLGLYAVAKGRSPLWGLFGLLSLIGLIVLAMLEDRAIE